MRIESVCHLDLLDLLEAVEGCQFFLDLRRRATTTIRRWIIDDIETMHRADLFARRISGGARGLKSCDVKIVDHGHGRCVNRLTRLSWARRNRFRGCDAMSAEQRER